MKGQTACYNLACQEKPQTDLFSAGGADTLKTQRTHTIRFNGASFRETAMKLTAS